jgi:phage recombination protein Bet
VTITPAAEATGAAKPAMSKGQLVALKPPRLPYHEAVEERFGIDRAGWKALVEAIYPNAETADAIVMALSYCRARNLDPFKRPVHIVPMWSSVAGKMIETVWPGISELRTTAFRTGQYAGMAAPEFGPTIERTFKGKAGRGKSKGQERSLTLQFPEWCRVTITREFTGKERSFVGPKVYWFEAYAKWADTDVPNEMWSNRPVGQLEKCAEAGALRRAFPEEIGNALTAEEMEGQHALDGAAHAAESRNASRPRVPERNANLSRRSCRNHSPSPHRHRPSFPNRSPPGKKAIPKSPMPAGRGCISPKFTPMTA